jgi:hypothetical protein
MHMTSPAAMLLLSEQQMPVHNSLLTPVIPKTQQQSSSLQPAGSPSQLPRRSPRRITPNPARVNVGDAKGVHVSADDDSVDDDDDDSVSAVDVAELMTPEIQELLANASVVTKSVDDYLTACIGESKLFFEVYFSDNARSIHIVQGAQQSAFKCSSGCVHPDGADHYQSQTRLLSQDILEHVLSEEHVQACAPSGVDTVAGLNRYMISIIPYLMTPEIRELMQNATPLTKAVDVYMFDRLGKTKFFFEIYFSHNARTIQVNDGDKLSSFKCNAGCVHPQRADVYPIPNKQQSQAIFDHIFRRKHVISCSPQGASTKHGLDAYVETMIAANPRSDRWEADGNKNKRNKARTTPRSKSKKPKPDAEDNEEDPTATALFGNETSIAAHTLNFCGVPGSGRSQATKAQITKQAQKKPTRSH